jgi:hypothetical protein
MTKRLKLYYPKSSIVENLYTPGGKYMLENGTAYSGQYHKYDTGEVYTGAIWDPNTSQKLLPLSNSAIPKIQRASQPQFNHFVNSDLNVRKYSNPKSEISIPIESDFDRGYYYRYFCEKRNEPSHIYEISNNSYISYGKPSGINEFLYKRGRVRWTLVGDEFDIYENNRIIRYGVLNQNYREVFALSKSFPYIHSVFGDYRQFTEYSRMNLNNPVKQRNINITVENGSHS